MTPRDLIHDAARESSRLRLDCERLLDQGIRGDILVAAIQIESLAFERLVALEGRLALALRIMPKENTGC